MAELLLAPLVLVLAAQGVTVDVPFEARIVVHHREVAGGTAAGRLFKETAAGGTSAGGLFRKRVAGGTSAGGLFKKRVAGGASADRLFMKTAPQGTNAGQSFTETVSLAWRVEAQGRRPKAVGRAKGASWEAEVWVVGTEEGVELGVGLTYLKDVRVEREALELHVAGDPVRAVGRDGRVREVPSLFHAGSMDQKVALLGLGTLGVILDASEFQGLELRREGTGRIAALELDDARNHPFFVESRCVRSWRKAGPRVEESARYRSKDERIVRVARLYAGESPVVVRRLPEGRKAALVFADHADQTTALTLRTLLWGEQGRGETARGFLALGLPLTKALFWKGEQRAPQLDAAEVRELARTLVEAGGEVALHSPTPRQDDRQSVAEALKATLELGVVTWIDHQPTTNCEAFTNGGWRAAPEGIVDLLAETGVRYVWAGGHESSEALNLLRPWDPGSRAPFFYAWAPPSPGVGEDRVFLFRSVWAYVPRERFFALLGNASLDKLEAEHGITILHTYLEAMRREPRLRPRNLFLARRDGRTVSVHSAFWELLWELRRRVDRGTLWVTTVRDLGDHLRSLGQVALLPAKDGGLRIVNKGPMPVRGLTIFLPKIEARLVAEGMRGEANDGEGHVVWLDLEAHAERRLTAHDTTGKAVPLGRVLNVGFRE